MFGLLNATLGKAKKEAEDRVGLVSNGVQTARHGYCAEGVTHGPTIPPLSLCTSPPLPSLQQAKRRAEIVSRQQERLEQQRSELLHEENLKKTLRREYEREYKLLEAILGGDAAFKSMRAQKRRLASFLVTSSPAATARSRGSKADTSYTAPASTLR